MRHMPPLRAGRVSMLCTRALPPMEGARFFRMGVLGDGSCFFHSLCTAIDFMGYVSEEESSGGHRQRITMEMRRQFAEDMQKGTWNSFVKSMHPEVRARVLDGTGRTLETVRANMLDPTFWADELLIRFVSWIMHLNVIFLDDMGDQLYCGVENMSKGDNLTLPTIVVVWVGRSHFEPVGVLLDQSRDREVVAKFVFTPGEDDAIVKHIVRAYREQCNA